MEKKIYSAPSMRIVKLESASILAASGDALRFNLNTDIDDYGTDATDEEKGIWGHQL